jgi:hypothetical protein
MGRCFMHLLAYACAASLVIQNECSVSCQLLPKRSTRRQSQRVVAKKSAYLLIGSQEVGLKCTGGVMMVSDKELAWGLWGAAEHRELSCAFALYSV